MALTDLLRRTRRRQDVEAYATAPLTGEEAGIAHSAVDWAGRPSA